MKTHQHIKLTKYDWLLYVSIIMVSGGQLINRFVKPVSDTAAYGLSGAAVILMLAYLVLKRYDMESKKK